MLTPLGAVDPDLMLERAEVLQGLALARLLHNKERDEDGLILDLLQARARIGAGRCATSLMVSQALAVLRETERFEVEARGPRLVERRGRPALSRRREG